MNHEDIKKGMYIRWTADRHFRSWDTFGKIMSIENGEVKIMTYDDFKETSISLDGDAVRDEIQPADMQKVVFWLKERLISATSKKELIKLEYEQAIGSAEQHLSKIRSCIDEITAQHETKVL